jgi:release factor glutamine methyltransferase
VNNNHSSVALWLTRATRRLEESSILSARLDAELILAHTLHRSRTWLHAHDDTFIDIASLKIADARLQLRAERVPLAYIIGHKEFYGRMFHVTPAVLIPRPESETIISLLDTILTPSQHKILDVGTGSGCLGITIKLEHPELQVTLSDVSNAALTVATENAAALHADIDAIQSDLLESITETFDVIVANLPYVDPTWETSPELIHEPAPALYANDGGLALIKRLIAQATHHLAPRGYLLLEADPCQHQAIITYAATHSYSHVTSEGYVVVLTSDEKH